MLRHNVIGKRSDLRIVYFDVEVKLWAEKLPSVGAVRPAKCPGCGAAGAPAGRQLGLVGHGTRERTVVGPLSASGEPQQVTLMVRRYVCRSCRAVITSAPRGLLRGMLYGAVAIALSLALWACEGLSSWQVRECVSPWGNNSHYARWHGWRTVTRWARDVQRYWRGLRMDPAGGARDRARSAVTQLAGRAASAGGPVVELACEGALRA